MTTVILGREKMEELYNQKVFKGYDFEHDSEIYKFIEEESMEMDDNGKYYTYIYQRESDQKYFMITLSLVRYGYEDYGYEDWANDGEMYEVEKKEKTITVWESVK